MPPALGMSFNLVPASTLKSQITGFPSRIRVLVYPLLDSLYTIFKKKYLIGGQLLYNILVVFAIH